MSFRCNIKDLLKNLNKFTNVKSRMCLWSPNIAGTAELKQ